MSQGWHSKARQSVFAYLCRLKGSARVALRQGEAIQAEEEIVSLE